nr:MAG TPA: hypothetical protein [Caudoviricetes sp.]
MHRSVIHTLPAHGIRTYGSSTSSPVCCCRIHISFPGIFKLF